MRGEASGGEQFLDDGAQARERGGKIRVGDFLAIEANAFIDSFQMRRRCTVPCATPCAQDGSRASRAVGALHRLCRRYAYGLKRAFGMAEALAKHRDIDEIELRRARLPRRGEFASQREQISDRFFVSHAGYARKKSSAEEIYDFRSLRWTTASRKPCSNRNSDV